MSEIVQFFHPKFTHCGCSSLPTPNILHNAFPKTPKNQMSPKLNVACPLCPRIDIRIGLDSGNAIVVTMGSPAAKQHKDIIGSVVSLACKIQSTANPGGLNLGQATYQNLHVKWKSKCRKIELPDGWKYKSSDGIPYNMYTIT